MDCCLERRQFIFESTAQETQLSKSSLQIWGVKVESFYREKMYVKGFIQLFILVDVKFSWKRVFN